MLYAAEEFPESLGRRNCAVRNNADVHGSGGLSDFQVIQRKSSRSRFEKFDDWKTCGSQLATRIRLRLVGRIFPFRLQERELLRAFCFGRFRGFGEFMAPTKRPVKGALISVLRKNSHVGGQPEVPLVSALKPAGEVFVYSTLAKGLKTRRQY